MTYDFHNLTQSQQWLLTVGGWDIHTRTISRPSAIGVKQLIDRGLVIEQGSGFVVPIDVHLAWCAHCAELEAASTRQQAAQQKHGIHVQRSC
jgi:hypothetical protein